ncbi:MAG: hypothetical protein QXN34_00765 [Archaeoglobaceae archaeon]
MRVYIFLILTIATLLFGCVQSDRSKNATPSLTTPAVTATPRIEQTLSDNLSEEVESLEKEFQELEELLKELENLNTSFEI